MDPSGTHDSLTIPLPGWPKDAYDLPQKLEGVKEGTKKKERERMRR
jgi:hypothetical protein